MRKTFAPNGITHSPNGGQHKRPGTIAKRDRQKRALERKRADLVHLRINDPYYKLDRDKLDREIAILAAKLE